jgi:hypothetical protein
MAVGDADLGGTVVADAGGQRCGPAAASSTRQQRFVDRYLDALRRQLDALVPLRHRALDWAHAAEGTATLGRRDLERGLASRASRRLIIAVSHDDYALSSGGVQTLIGDEQKAGNRAGWGYLHVSPAAPLPMLADPLPADRFRVRLRLDGAQLGVAAFSDLVRAVAERRQHGVTAELVFHHLSGHAPELLVDLLAAAGVRRPICWVHDFFTLCPSYGLMRNDVAFCGAPALRSPACDLCCYGDERVRHAERMGRFFEAADPDVLAPSEAALDFWLRKGTLPHGAHGVLPHARLVMAPTAIRTGFAGARRPLRVAHLGAAATLKGWHVFRELASAFADDPRYRFLYLGAWRPPDLPAGVRHVPVTVTVRDRFAMVEAVAEARVDVAVIWTLCFETFCYTAHEALAGGAFVLARADAGNVWPAIAHNAPQQGCTVADEKSLFDLLDAGGLMTAVDSAKRRRGALIPGGGTLTWLREHAQRSPSAPAARTESVAPPAEAGV